jgi:hypothetical protein
MTFKPGMIEFRNLSKRQKELWLMEKIQMRPETNAYIKSMTTNRTRQVRFALKEVKKTDGQLFTLEQLQNMVDECEKERLTRLQ